MDRRTEKKSHLGKINSPGFRTLKLTVFPTGSTSWIVRDVTHTNAHSRYFTFEIQYSLRSDVEDPPD